ncbi:MAG: chorismate-binding protein [Bacteroidales bacterium]|nr:chorismate-binding protein [Bacteroidales bacterium]
MRNLANLIQVCLEKQIPFVSFRLPHEKTLQTWVQVSGRFDFFESIEEIGDQSGFVYAPFHRRTNFPVIFFKPEQIFRDDLIVSSFLKELARKEPFYPDYEVAEPPEISKDEYLNQAGFIIHSFEQNFKKAVLSRVQKLAKPDNFDLAGFFVRMQNNYPQAFCHLIHIPGTGTWAGATPETLLRIEGELAQTVSLAGTQALSDYEKRPIWQEKDLEEQQIVTDYIEDLLKKYHFKNYKKENLENANAGHLVHLATRFSFEKRNIESNLGFFLSALHPTPAICGFPKEKALEMILKTENHNREYYAGFCGPVNYLSRTDLFVNLRCMKILPDSLALFLGGGLTAKSDPAKEWDETVLKSQTLKKLI